MTNGKRGPLFTILFAALMAGAGNGITIVAFPWLVLQHNGSALDASVVAMAAVPVLALIFGVHVVNVAVLAGLAALGALFDPARMTAARGRMGRRRRRAALRLEQLRLEQLRLEQQGAARTGDRRPRRDRPLHTDGVSPVSQILH